MTFTPDDGSAPQTHEVFHFESSGVAMGMYNLDESIRGFAKACFEYALDKQWYAQDWLGCRGVRLVW